MPRHLTFGGSSRTTTAVAGTALAAVGVIVYLSPLGPGHSEARSTTRVVRSQLPRSGTPLTPTPKHIRVTSVRADRPPAATVTKNVSYAETAYRYQTLVRAAIAAARHPSSAAANPTCSTFRWQQDAQRVYRANLSDPFGLDGPVGPMNGNGRACDELPTDPGRRASTPVDAYVWAAPDPPSKSGLLHPAGKYYGLAADGLPGDGKLYDTVDAGAGRAPNLVEWFQYFDEPYPADKVSAAWVRGALPVITWMSAPSDYTHRGDLSGFSLAGIAAGRHDGYLRAWAARIAVQQLPVVIRFDHESNGNWYPWSVGWHKQGITGNTPAQYRAAWQHIWNVFAAMGANAYTIWAYVPTRIDTLGTYGSGYPSQRAIVAASYPGDRYVDWVGVDGYQYDPAESTTYRQTFAASFAALSSFTGKPILVAEMGAAEDGAGGVKPKWITQTYAGLAADPRVIGACYFDNDVSGVHYLNGVPVRTDWRFTSSAPARAAFRAAVSDGAFGAGIYPPYLLGD